MGIIRPVDPVIIENERGFCLQVSHIACEFDRPEDMLSLIKFADETVNRPPDRDPPQRAGDVPLQRPDDSPVAIRPQDDPTFQRTE